MYYQAWEFFAWNLAGGVTISVWTAGTCWIMFSLLQKYKCLRVEDKALEQGLDLHEHGELAYVFNPPSKGSEAGAPLGIRVDETPVSKSFQTSRI